MVVAQNTGEVNPTIFAIIQNLTVQNLGKSRISLDSIGLCIPQLIERGGWYLSHLLRYTNQLLQIHYYKSISPPPPRIFLTKKFD